MIVYRDLLSNDELFTDSCKMREVDDSVFIEVEGKHTTECTKVDDAMIGGNKSAESYEEESADASTSGVDIVLQNRLAWVDMDKKKYQKYIKAYVAKLVEKLTETKPDYVATFKKKAIPAVKRILDNFEEWDPRYSNGVFLLRIIIHQCSTLKNWFCLGRWARYSSKFSCWVVHQRRQSMCLRHTRCHISQGCHCQLPSGRLGPNRVRWECQC